MGRGWAMLLGAATAAFAALVLTLNFADPDIAFRAGLCPEKLELERARRLVLNGSPRAAATLYRRLALRNPGSPYLWCHLGDAYLAAGDHAQARRSFAMAASVGPAIPQTLLRVAGFHFRLGENRRALEYWARVLALCPDYDRLIFSYYERTGEDLDAILRYGMPRQSRPARSYFSYLLASGEADLAARTWAWLSSLGFQDAPLAGAYCDLLVRNRHYSEAASVWDAYLSARSSDASHGLLHNGGFESEPLASPFDWRILPCPAASVRRDTEFRHGGDWSLRIEFLGNENVSYRHITQLAVIKPGTLRFAAYCKADNLTTDQGVAFRIVDFENPSRLSVETPQALGSFEWRRFEVTFNAPRSTRVLEVQIVRKPSWKFDSRISGIIWVDDVCLETVGNY